MLPLENKKVPKNKNRAFYKNVKIYGRHAWSAHFSVILLFWSTLIESFLLQTWVQRSNRKTLTPIRRWRSPGSSIIYSEANQPASS